jgi:putative ABC transport system permease protein
VASAIKQRLAKQNISVVMTVYQDPDRHWGHSVVDGMAVILQVLAALSLLLSVVLVLNTVTAIITQQTNQIGIMKAVGGSSVSMLKIYLSGILVVGLLSLVIAFPLGTFTAYQLTRWLLGFYNIEYNQFILQPQMIALQAFAALVVPLLAAMLPAMHAAAITVREAIASYGLGGDFGFNWFDRGIEQIGRRFFSSVNAIALANTFRRKGRLTLSQLVLVIAGVMFMIVTSLSRSMVSTIDTEFSRRSYDVAIFFEGMQRQDRTIRLAESTDGVSQADMWLVIPVTILREGQKTLDAGTGSQIKGVPLDDPMYAPLIVEGRWLRPGDGRVVVMAQDTAQDENIKVGDMVTLDMGNLGEHDWKVVGLYHAFTVLGGDFNPDEIFAPREAVYQASKKTGKGSTLLVRTTEGGDEIENRIGGALETLFEDQQMDVYRIETMTTQQNFLKTSFSIVINMLVVLALIVALVGGIGLMGSMWIGVIERTKEIGIMRAIGARSHNIIRMFILEGMVQGALSWLIALPIARWASPFLSDAMGQAMFQTDLDFYFDYRAAFLWLGIVLLVSLLAAVIPARNAARIVIRESLAYE